MAYYSSGSSLLNDVMPKLKQYRATTGRDMSPQVIQGLLQAKIKEETAAANDARRLDLQQTNQDRANEIAKQNLEIEKDKAKAAGMQGLLTLPATAYGTVKSTQALYDYATGPPKVAPTATPGTTPAPGAAPAPGPNAGVQEAAGVAGATGETLGAQSLLSPAATSTPGMAGYGMAEGAGEAGLVGAEGAAESTGLLGGSTAMTAAGYAGGGYLLGQAIKAYSPIGGKTEKSIASHVATGAGIGAAAGSYVPVIGTAIGGVIGGAVGLVTGAVSNSVICSELLRQGEITEQERKWAVLFRHKFISDEMFNIYLEWAAPYVTIMQRGGTGNEELKPRMKAFVSYMVKTAKGKETTSYEQEVWDEIWTKGIEIINSERMAA